ncbi:MAG: hypothetical protein J0H31_08320 [Alphaproteobacteria bacterium]|nr:hypothetical protein [Alphaproteobacteria bacterium]
MKLAIGAAILCLGMASAAQAMPNGLPTTDDSLITNVAMGCGPGWHPNYWGRCVPNRRVIYPGYYHWGGPRVYVGPVWHPYHRWHHWRRW